MSNRRNGVPFLTRLLSPGRRRQRRMVRTAGTVCALMCLASASAPADLAVRVRTADGRERTGNMNGIDAEGLVLSSGDVTRRIALDDLIDLHRVATDVDRTGGASLLFLTTGDRIAVEVVRLHDDALICRMREFEDEPEFRAPLENLLGLVLKPVDDARARRALEGQLQQRDFQTDVLFLTSGDRLAGVFEKLDGNSCRCETAAGPIEVNRSRVRAVGFNSALLAPVEDHELRIVLHLADGSWLTCRSARWQGQEVMRAVTTGGIEVPVPARSLESVSFYGHRVRPLSELEPLESVMTPYLTRETPMQRDRNARGGPLTLRGRSYARGLGMYTRTTATYPLQGDYSSFQCVVGIDDAAVSSGSVVFAVAVDGQRVFESGLVTSRNQPLQIGPIDLRNADSITLDVDYGTRGDIGDLADWCNPVLIR